MRLLKLSEPKLLFGQGQAVEDPRDGLTLFGPLDSGVIFGVRPALIGTADGIERFWRWVESIQRPIDDRKFLRPPFSGFEAAFNVPFGKKGILDVKVDSKGLLDACHIGDVHQRVHRVVRLYTDRILQARNEDERADVWFVVVPDEVYRRCRPKSVVPDGMKVNIQQRISPAKARKVLGFGSYSRTSAATRHPTVLSRTSAIS